MGVQIDSGVILMVSPEDFYELKAEVTTNSKEISRLAKVLDGNGREGLVQTTTRIEERLTSFDERFDSLEASIKEFTGKLDSVVNKPIPSFKDLIWDNKGIIGKAVIGIIILSVIIHILLPHNVTVWDLLKLIIGL